jgi:hypothetical protein
MYIWNCACGWFNKQPYIEHKCFVALCTKHRTQQTLPAHPAALPLFSCPDKQFLEAFAKLRKATISFVMYVRPTALMEQLDSHWTDFDQI